MLLLQQLLAGKSDKSGAAADYPTRLLRQLLFSDSDCQVVRLIRLSLFHNAELTFLFHI